MRSFARRISLLSGHNIFAVIPALNEASTIAAVIHDVRTYIQQVVVVNDGSKDETSLEASKAGAHVIHHQYNLGYDQSLISGFKFALYQGADIILTFDADGQHDVVYLPSFIQPIIDDKADVVAGQRPSVTDLTERIFAAYTRQRFSIRDPLCGLKAYSRKICLSVNLNKSEGFIGTYLLLKALKGGYRVQTYDIGIHERKDLSRFYYFNMKAHYSILKAFSKTLFLK